MNMTELEKVYEEVKYDEGSDHWLCVKQNTGSRVYLKYRYQNAEDADRPDAYVDWRVYNLQGGVVDKNQIWCQKKDCQAVMRSEEIVRIVFGWVPLVYREVQQPLYVCA